ncbi:MAG: peptidoglycan DD-metalloendopeptidase family protein [Patescibacteria group bacterium]|nr:peptidoglycan DD-metalloendopeptidase family protein [Patescibacteria group bacterium]
MHFLRVEKANKNKIHFEISTKLQVFVSLVLLCTFFGATPIYSMSQQEYQDQVSQLDAQIAAANAQITQLSAQKKSLSNEVSILDSQINEIQLKINVFQQQIDLTTKQIDNTNLQIVQAEADLKTQKEIMSEYLKTMYIEGQVSTIELIAKSKSFSDFVNQSEYMGTMQQNVQDTSDKIVSLKQQLEKQKREMETEKAKNEQLKTEQVAAQQGILNQKSTKDNLILQTKGQEANYQAIVKAAQRKEADAWASYQLAIQGASSSGGSTYVGGSGSGYLSWPINGYLSQGYGCTEYAMCGNPNGPYGGKIHNGLDIASFSGDPIHAAGDGYVLDEGYEFNSQGWGNWIIIRHSNGLATLYAHQSSFAVVTGQAVSKGQVIGYEGSTGNSTGAHVHFSVFTNLILYNVAGYHGPKYEGTVDPRSFL